MKNVYRQYFTFDEQIELLKDTFKDIRIQERAI